jgi:hypothetical protein
MERLLIDLCFFVLAELNEELETELREEKLSATPILVRSAR